MALNIEPVPPEATVCSVFEDAHSQAQAMVERLETMCTESGINPGLSRKVPGFSLFVDVIEGTAYSGGQRRTCKIGAAEPKQKQFGLVSVTRVHKINSAKGILPMRVQAYRGHERHADYSIAEQSYKGKIAIHLGRAGISGSQLSNEPFGNHDAYPEQKVSDLDEEAVERLLVVRQNILSNLNDIELVLGGASVAEVFADRTLPQGVHVLARS